MKLISILPLAAIAGAFVIPDERLMREVPINSHTSSKSVFDRLPTKEQVVAEAENAYSQVIQTAKNAFDQAIEYTEETGDIISQVKGLTYAESWSGDVSFSSQKDHDHHGHHGHHGHDCHKPNKTVYQLISENKYTTKLAKLINEYDDVVALLNGTATNYTIFAPIDSAFEKIPKDLPKPTKEDLKNILLYHISSDFYPAGRVLVTSTIPSSLVAKKLGGKLQRLSTNIGLKGLTVNFYSRIIAVDFVSASEFVFLSVVDESQFGTNGVIHGVDSLLIPPPNSVDIITYLPGEFSTLELALRKTDLIDKLNDTTTHTGGTLFAPSNFAFQLLGPRVNAFLFSSYGLKYLKALLKYHVVPNQTLYSDAFYKAEDAEVDEIPKGVYHASTPNPIVKTRSLICLKGRSPNIA